MKVIGVKRKKGKCCIKKVKISKYLVCNQYDPQGEPQVLGSKSGF